MAWNPGDHITLRYTGHSDGKVAGRPGLLMGWGYIVVEDRPDLLALWTPAGTLLKRVDMADRRHVVDDELWRLDMLRLMFPGKPYSICLFWSPRQEEFRQWYVNLEAPFVRTSIGVDTTDNVLDVVVSPDLSWHWKDEDDLQRWIDLGVYTREEMDLFFEHGREVIAAVEARAFPFDGSFLDWRPPSHWTPPKVHSEWDRVPDYDLPLTTGRRLVGVDHPLLKGSAMVVPATGDVLTPELRARLQTQFLSLSDDDSSGAAARGLA